MQFAAHDLGRLTETTWQTVFGQDLTQDSEVGSAPDSDNVAAAVDIGGAWSGRLMITFPHELARQVTAEMFDVPLSEAEAELMRDALGEIANIIGGGVKALVGEECTLSLPTFAEGASCIQEMRRGQELSRVGFAAKEHRFEVTLLEDSSNE